MRSLSSNPLGLYNYCLSMASLPLLMVYYVTTNRTEVVVPTLLQPLLGLAVAGGR